MNYNYVLYGLLQGIVMLMLCFWFVYVWGFQPRVAVIPGATYDKELRGEG